MKKNSLRALSLFVMLVLLGTASFANGATIRGERLERGTQTSSPTNPPQDGEDGQDGDAIATANTGGNEGGNVTTGDENVTVTVINIGPTNSNNSNNNPPPPPAEEEEDDSCVDRGCRPSR